jgi:hypothetical protein
LTLGFLLIHGTSTNRVDKKGVSSVKTPLLQLPKGNFIHPRFQLTLIGITFAILAVLFYRPFHDLRVSDPKINLIAVQHDNGRHVVDVGLYIKDFSKFDLLKNKFEYDATVWFQTKDRSIDIDKLSKFSFAMGEVVKRSEPIIERIDDTLLVRYDVMVKHRSVMDFHFFPFEDHRLNCHVINNYLDDKDYVWRTSNTNALIDHAAAAPGWHLLERKAQAGLTKQQLRQGDPATVVESQSAVFTFLYEQNGARNVMGVMLPLLMLLFILLFTFCLNPEVYSISSVGAGIGGMTGVLAYRYVIDNLSPSVGYLMLADYLFFLTLFCVTIIFIANTMSAYLSTRAKKIISVGICAIVIAACAYLFL